MIDAFMTDEQKKLQIKYRELVAEYVRPRAREVDDTDRIPQDLLVKLAGDPFHLPALSVPKKFGGQELPQVEVGIIGEEIAYGVPALIPLMEIGQLYSYVLLLGGTDDQQKRFLSALAEGKIGCYALTDEGPGSDPARMKSTATETDDGFLLNGKKRLITFADLADLFAIFANENPSKGARGVSAFIFPQGIEGLKLDRHVEYLGLLGHRAYDISMHDIKVPKDNRIGGQGDGLRLALSVLNVTRISLAWGYCGLARAALEACIEFSKEREIGNQPLGEYQSIRFAIAELATQIDAARMLAYRASVMEDKKLKHRRETSMAKLATANALINSVDLAVRIHAGYGGDKEFKTPVERYLRDAYSWIAAQGTPEVQKLVISRELFK